MQLQLGLRKKIQSKMCKKNKEAVTLQQYSVLRDPSCDCHA